MTTITELHEKMQTLLTETANGWARSSGFIQRQRQVTGAGFAQALVLGGLAQPEATRKQQQQAAVQAGMTISPQGLEQRFQPSAVVFMRGLLEAGLSEVVGSEDERIQLPQFAGVYVTDCTRLEWGTAGVKLGVRWELQRGQLQASLSELRTHDQMTPVVATELPAGSLHLGDLGFFKLKRFADWNQQGVYWLTRYKVGTRLFEADGVPLPLLDYLEKATEAVTLPVQVGCQQHLCAYLVADRLPDDLYAQRLERMQKHARRKQQLLSTRQTTLARWTIYLTNISHLTFSQAHLLARTRWQIELLFKLWKSHGKILISRSADPVRQQCEGYAKLLGVVVAHWLLLVCGWQHEQLSAVDALRIIRSYVPFVMRAFTCHWLWHWLFVWLRQDLCHAPRLSRRRKTPLVFQLWLDFDLVLP